MQENCHLLKDVITRKKNSVLATKVNLSCPAIEMSSIQEYGENLYCSWSSNPKAKCAGSKPVDSWYSEMTKYTFGSEPTSSASGEYPQNLH